MVLYLDQRAKRNGRAFELRAFAHQPNVHRMPLGRPGSIRPIRMHAELTLALRQLSELQQVLVNPNPTTDVPITNIIKYLYTDYPPSDDAHTSCLRGLPTGGRDGTGRLHVALAMGGYCCARAGGATPQRARRGQKQARRSPSQVLSYC